MMRRMNGVADGARTHDNQNHNLALYQLNYGHHIKKPLARPARLERATLALEGRCSIQLSYGRNAVLIKNGRGREIRTPDPLLPKQLRYQAALYPDWSYFTHFIKLANFIRSPT